MTSSFPGSPGLLPLLVLLVPIKSLRYWYQLLGVIIGTIYTGLFLIPINLSTDVSVTPFYLEVASPILEDTPLCVCSFLGLCELLALFIQDFQSAKYSV